jgi:hypothetical protein
MAIQRVVDAQDFGFLSGYFLHLSTGNLQREFFIFKLLKNHILELKNLKKP